MANKKSKYTTFSELVKTFGITRTSLVNWVENGSLPCEFDKSGRRIFVREVAEPIVKKLTKAAQEKKLRQKVSVHEKINEAKAVKENYAARMAKLKYETQLGELVKIEAVEKRLKEIAYQIRDSLLQLPNKISPELSSMENVREINIFITKEIRNCLSLISEGEFEKIRKSIEKKSKDIK